VEKEGANEMKVESGNKWDSRMARVLRMTWNGLSSRASGFAKLGRDEREHSTMRREKLCITGCAWTCKYQGHKVRPRRPASWKISASMGAQSAHGASDRRRYCTVSFGGNRH
jgi:hypothetical protein